MNADMRLEPVEEGEEYPIMGGHSPEGFERTQSGYACKVCGAMTPLMARWAQRHAEWHTESGN